MANTNLSNAKAGKNDEFYTQYNDIQREINSYIEYNQDVFRGKTILLPCDDPEWSNFTKFFAQNFEFFGLKKLISTSYAVESKKIKEWQPTLFETESPYYDAGKSRTHGKIFILDEDTNNDGRFDINDLKWDYLEGDGDFRSDEVKTLRDEADIIVTNPPFSLFNEEFLPWLIESGKQFLVICNKNCVTCKTIFPLIMDNKMWSGVTKWSGGMWFETVDKTDVDKFIDGKPFKNTPSIWLTNIEHGRRHDVIDFMTTEDNLLYSKHKEIKSKGYLRYDNFDAIDVPYGDAIPNDYDGAMGVPVSFLEKYCPEQFEILGLTQIGCHDKLPDTRKYNDYKEILRSNDKPTGSSGGKTNENAVLPGKGTKKTYYLGPNGEIVHSEYKRLLIRKK